MDCDGRAVHEGRAHGGGEGDEGFFIKVCFDLDDGGDRYLGVFCTENMHPGKTGFAPRAKVDDLRALDQAARFQIDAFLAVLQGQFQPVAYQRLARAQFGFGCVMGAAKGVDQA